MRPSVFFGLCANLFVCPSLAVLTWTPVGCAGVTANGVTIDSIWDNALLMVQTAQTRIDSIRNFPIKAKSTRARVANNAHYMFGIDVNWSTGFASSTKKTLSDVRSIYSRMESKMNEDTNYLLCNDNGFQWGNIGGYTTGVWYYAFPGTNDALILRSTAGNSAGDPIVPKQLSYDFEANAGPSTNQNESKASQRPCGESNLAGETFTGEYMSSTAGGTVQYTQTTAILLCVQNQLMYKPTLELGFTVSDNKGIADEYESVSGTIVHEMVHALNTHMYWDQTHPDFPNDGLPGYGFDKCMILATKSPQQALVNPDNYRIFAEMCMSPKTEWQPAEPAGA
ncbi:uncharacterized protein DSM5745_00238 [Aspergillus mulundensis]|uniref:Lysine-specific metallo-endopeptidase domain-containing protein n=1 Tax=Aspergillus mulundensis TaxID=1810919 RepID=A0A3D8T2Y5_9EURO|nr:hypothetical protein DSM5745_00238 [Aspergillus mulundensis]RDW92916.1 hypothetical protein DSM5745_00238 [Aspergillus mulundensis]